MPANILNLTQYRVLRVEESDHDYHVTAEPVDVTSACPHCQSDRLTSWGTREHVFKDLPVHGKRVGIYIVPSAFTRGCLEALRCLEQGCVTRDQAVLPRPDPCLHELAALHPQLL